MLSLISTVGTMAEDFRAEALSAPAVIVVGEVVRLRDRIVAAGG